LTNEDAEGFGDCKMRGQLICTVNYADALVLPVKEEKALQGMVDRRVEAEMCCGNKHPQSGLS
jgi:hypothetical protein